MDDPSARVVITCTCGQKMKVPAEARGKRYKCVKCGAQVTVEESPGGTVAAGRPGAAAATPGAGASVGRERIGQMLIKAGLITSEQLEEALDAQRVEGGKTFENLIRLGHLNKEALHDFLSKQPGVATIKLANYKIEHDLVDLIPKELALREKILPIDRLGKLLTIAMACPTDIETVEEIQRVTGLKVKAMLCRLDDIEQAVEKLYGKGRAARSEAELFERILASEPEHAAPPKMAAKPIAPPMETKPVTAPVETKPPAPQVKEAPQAKEAAPKEELTPGMVRRFIAMAEDPNTSTRELARAAQDETPLADVLLRAANSGLYGLTEQVESAAMAVVLMGKEGVAELLKAAFE